MVNSNLRIGGLSSGIDTDSLVRDLMKLARMPLDKKIRDKQTWTWKQEDYRSINLRLLALKNKAFDMKLESPFLAKQVNSADSSIVTASAVPTAAEGTYHIKVVQLATAATNVSTGAISLDQGDKVDTGQSLLSQAGKFDNPGAFFDGKVAEDTFSVVVNGEEFTFTYGETLNSIISTINKNKDVGVSLFYDSATDKLAISSTATGAGTQLELTGDLFNAVLKVDNQQKTAGSDASFELNGMQTTRSGNSFTINGVTFNLKGLTSGGLNGEPVQVVVQTDTDAVYDCVVDFINEYNEVYEEINSKLKEEKYREYHPLTDEEKEALSDPEIERWEERAKSGLLKHDTMINTVINDMRSSMSRIVQGLDGPRSLAEIGITTGNYWDGNEGKLVINESKLRAAIEEDPEGVAKLFNNNGVNANEQGIACRLYDTMTASLARITSHAGSSAALYDQSYISRTIREIDNQIDSLEDRLVVLEERYWRQFTAMERAISSMNQQSSWLNNQLAGMMGQK